MHFQKYGSDLQRMLLNDESPLDVLSGDGLQAGPLVCPFAEVTLLAITVNPQSSAVGFCVPQLLPPPRSWPSLWMRPSSSQKVRCQGKFKGKTAPEWGPRERPRDRGPLGWGKGTLHANPRFRP